MPYPRKYKIVHSPDTRELGTLQNKKKGTGYHEYFIQSSYYKSRKDKQSLRLPYKRYIYSWRFGYVDLIDQTQQKSIICPSGFTWGQGWGVLNKCWIGYKIAKNLEQSIENMKSFAKKIQDIQYDLGLTTSDFSHLGLPGDVLVLYDKPPNQGHITSGTHPQVGTEIITKKEKKKKKAESEGEGEVPPPVDEDVPAADEEIPEPDEEEINSEEYLKDLWLVDSISETKKTEQTE